MFGGGAGFDRSLTEPVTFGLLQFVQETLENRRVAFAQRSVELLEPLLNALPVVVIDISG